MRTLPFLLADPALRLRQQRRRPSPPPSSPITCSRRRRERVRTDDVLKVSDAMRRYLAVDIADQIRIKGAQAGLVDALYQRAQLKLEYDAAQTKTAAEAFDGRSGNCLSLVLMTAALAQGAGSSRCAYQSAYMDEAWSRSGNLLFASGHVNITLGRRLLDASTLARPHPAGRSTSCRPRRSARLRTRDDRRERRCVAMYANNRAAEALARRQARRRLRLGRRGAAQGPGVHRRVQHARRRLPAARRPRRMPSGCSSASSQREPKNTRALANLAETYARQGAAGRRRGGAHRAWRRSRRCPPFHFFDLGLDGAAARRLAHRARPLRARGGARRRQPRVPLLARRRRLAARRRRAGAQPPELAMDNSTDPRPARPLRRQARLAAVARRRAVAAGRPELTPPAQRRRGARPMDGDDFAARRESMVATRSPARGMRDPARARGDARRCRARSSSPGAAPRAPTTTRRCRSRTGRRSRSPTSSP